MIRHGAGPNVALLEALGPGWSPRTMFRGEDSNPY